MLINKFLMIKYLHNVHQILENANFLPKFFCFYLCIFGNSSLAAML